MIRFNDIPEKLTIDKIFEYTYRYLPSRFDNYERDIIKSKLVITERRKYKKNKEGKFSAPDELLYITSYSHPNYKPYTNHLRKGAKKQRKYTHHYDTRMAIQKTPNGTYSYYNSHIVWRVGTYRKWQKAPQSKIKSIYKETRNQLERKYKRLSDSDRKKAIKKDIDKIKKNAKYLDNGDYNSQVNGLNGDFYFRQQFVMNQFGCLYGPCTYLEPCEGVDLPFFGKHDLACIYYLIVHKILRLE